MQRDPIVEEIRNIRDAIARECDYNIAAIVATLIRKQEARRQVAPPEGPDAPLQGVAAGGAAASSLVDSVVDGAPSRRG